MKEDQEIWKDIPGYEGLYQVSNLGRIKSFKKYRGTKERILKQTKDASGYLGVKLTKNKKSITNRIHQLVAITFLNHKPSKFSVVVDHIDGDRLNNKLDNLQLTTQRHNASKGMKNIYSKHTGVTWCKKYKIWYSRIYIDGKLKTIGKFDNEIEAAEAYKIELKKLKEKTNGNITYKS